VTVVVAGEALVDLRPDGRGGTVAHPGGSPANVAVALGRLRHPVWLLTALGDDEYGDLVRKHLGGSQVNVVAAHVPRTSTATVTLGAAGDAHYELDLLVDLPNEPGAPDVQWLHVGSLAALHAPAADKVLELMQQRRTSVMVSYDPNLRGRPTPQQRARVEKLVSLSRLVKLSEDDAALFEPALTPDDLARSWLDLGADVVVVTRGAQGAFAVTRDGRRTAVPAAQGEPVVDTIGAGDAFMAGLIHSLLSDQDCLAALEFASVVARRTCERAGADPPLLD